MTTLYYLASPYSHCDPLIVEGRFLRVCEAAAELFRAGHHVFSPIAHCHPIAQYGLPTDWNFWQEYARVMLSKCDEVLVLRLDGWEESEGLRREIALAKELGKPIKYA